MENVFVLSDVNGNFRIVEAFERKGSWSHNDGDLLGGFENKDQAIMYCDEFNLSIRNN